MLFLNKIISKVYDYIYPAWTQDKILNYYNQFNNNISKFRDALIYQEFQCDYHFCPYDNHFMDISFPYYQIKDITSINPSQLLSRKFGNSKDYMKLYEDFIIQTKCAKKIQQFEMSNEDETIYHYASLITLNDNTIKCQNNMELYSKSVFELFDISFPNIKLINVIEI